VSRWVKKKRGAALPAYEKGPPPSPLRVTPMPSRRFVRPRSVGSPPHAGPAPAPPPPGGFQGPGGLPGSRCFWMDGRLPFFFERSAGGPRGPPIFPPAAPCSAWARPAALPPGASAWGRRFFFFGFPLFSGGNAPHPGRPRWTESGFPFPPPSAFEKLNRHFVRPPGPPQTVAWTECPRPRSSGWYPRTPIFSTTVVFLFFGAPLVLARLSPESPSRPEMRLGRWKNLTSPSGFFPPPSGPPVQFSPRWFGTFARPFVKEVRLHRPFWMPAENTVGNRF